MISFQFHSFDLQVSAGSASVFSFRLRNTPVYDDEDDRVINAGVVLDPQVVSRVNCDKFTAYEAYEVT